MKDIENALLIYQKNYLRANLSKYRIVEGEIPGIGKELVKRLAQSGINTAIDINENVITVKGIGENKAKSLISWRKNIEYRINSNLPKSLPFFEESNIKNNYTSKNKVIEDKKKVLDNNIIINISNIKQNYIKKRDDLMKETQLLKDQYFREQSKNNTEIENIEKKISEKQWTLSVLSKNYEPYKDISFKKYMTNVLLDI
jgi:DNA-binding helix-hairpin-helix protein with protein kinase domain